MLREFQRKNTLLDHDCGVTIILNIPLLPYMSLRIPPPENDSRSQTADPKPVLYISLAGNLGVLPLPDESLDGGHD
jgi:hypothetical protein